MTNEIDLDAIERDLEHPIFVKLSRQYGQKSLRRLLMSIPLLVAEIRALRTALQEQETR